MTSSLGYRDSTISVVLRMIASCTLVYTWLVHFFLQPLRKDSMIMHDQQLDPTEIVLIPYPWQRLTIYVLANVVAAICIQSSVRCMIQTCLDILQLSFIFMILFVVCGASPYHNIRHTFIASIYFVTCTFFQYPSIIVDAGTTVLKANTVDDNDETNKTDVDTSEKNPSTKALYHIPPTVDQLKILRIPQLLDTINLQLRGQSMGITGQAMSPSPSSLHQQSLMLLHQSIVYCCIILTVLFQILLLYDRGYQIQRYPIPIVFGCTVGWMIGTCMGSIRAIRQ